MAFELSLKKRHGCGKRRLCISSLAIALAVANAAANAMGDSPKLSDEPPPGRIGSGDASGEASAKLQSSAQPIAAATKLNPQNRFEVDTSFQCKLDLGYRVPIATRWWQSGTSTNDVTFCVRVGVGGSTGSTLGSWPIHVVGPSGIVTTAPNSVMLGGQLNVTNTWPGKSWSHDVTSAEMCSVATVNKQLIDDKSLQLKFKNPAMVGGGGFCTLPFGKNQRPPLMGATKRPDLPKFTP